MTASGPTFQRGGDPLDPSAVITRAFDAYRANLGVLLPISLVVFAVPAILAAVLGRDLVAAIVAGIISTAALYIFQGIVVEVARDTEDGVLDSSIGQLISAVAPAVIPLFFVGLLAGIAIGIGIVLILVPGLFLMTIWAVVSPVTVLERPGVFAAFGRSRALVRGSGWQVFGLILFNLLATFVAQRLAGLVGFGIGGAFLSWAVTAVLAPFTGLVIAQAYLRLREVHGEPPLPTGAAHADGPLAH